MWFAGLWFVFQVFKMAAMIIIEAEVLTGGA